jgi:hypothetical protein
MLLSFIFLVSSHSNAQDILPEGIMAGVYGYRHYAPVTTEFDKEGQRKSIVDPFKLKLNGRGLLDGRGGSELQRLGREISKYDSRDQKGGVLDRLKLGEVQADGKASIDGQYVGFAYGWSPRWTFFAIVPYVNARTDVSLSWAGENNALQIKQELGELAFDELKQALDRASRINIQDIEKTISDLGYKPVRSWSHTGFADVQVGARTSYNFALSSKSSYTLNLTGFWSIPTGYADDPDILTDFSFGDEVHTLSVDADNSLRIGYLIAGVSPYIKIGVPGPVQRRLPENDETLVAADRKTSVMLMPGPTVGSTFYGGAGGKMFSAVYRLGTSFHQRDQYSGSMSGNYKALSEDSESQTNFHEAVFRVSTIDAYMSKKFFMPAIFGFTAHQDMKGRNSREMTYFEFSIGSFLDIASPSKQNNKKVAKTNRSRP